MAAHLRAGARTARSRSAAALALGFCAALALLLGGPLASSAAAAPASAGGAGGQTLTVSQADGLSPDGSTVTVSGSGYDTLKGIYVAFCVTPATGQLPTPCGGGAATSGSGGLSGWVSSNPPSYGKDLVTPFGDGGTFSLQMTVSALIGTVDCTAVSCAIVTRADHTRSDDRSADAVIPITFGGAAAAEPTPPAETPVATPPAETTSAETTAAETMPTTATPSSSTMTIAGTGGASTDGPTDGPLIATRDEDSGSSVAPIVIGGGVLGLLAIGGAGYLAQRRRSGSRGPDALGGPGGSV